MTRRLALAVAVAASVLATRQDAAAVCNMSACSAAQLASCCGATSCTLDGTVTVSGPVCNFDFGARNVFVTGTLNVGSNTLTIAAGSLRITGFVNARGTSPNRGGTVRVTTNGGAAPAFSIAGGTGIDVSGFGSEGGGTLEVLADGAVSLTAGGITANGLEPNANGGTVRIDTSAGGMTIAIPIVAISGLNGVGGFVDLLAAGPITVGDAARLAATGGSGFGGEIDLETPGAISIAQGAALEANALNGSAADGGEINVTGGSVLLEGTLAAKGGGDPTGDFGGSGGSVTIEATSGSLVLMRGTQAISVDAAGGGDGGQVNLTTVSAMNGALTMSAPISSVGMGGSTGRPGGGGEITAESAAGLLLTKSIDITGVGNSTGLVELSAERGDVVVNNTIGAMDFSGGAFINIEASRNVTFANTGSGRNVRVNASGDGSGGEVFISAGNDVSITDFFFDATGAGTGKGGNINIDAGRNVVVDTKSLLTVNSTASSNREGGTIIVQAGFPDQAGDVQIDGDLTAVGHAPGAAILPGSITLIGCQLTVTATGLVDSTGDPGASNTFMGRKGIAVTGTGKVRTTAAAAGGKNIAIYPTGTAPAVGPDAQVSPPFSATCAGGCARPVCTQKNPPAPAGCLMPCPTCGNGQVAFPEDCDPPGCPACNIHCRALGGCSDSNPCTSDTCDAAFGCVNEPRPPGSTCDDATICNGRETCQVVGSVEVCKSDGALDCDDENPCTSDSCNAQNGCAHGAINGRGVGGCNDRCVETCSNGTCVPVTPPNCDDGSLATRDFCNPDLCTGPGAPSCCDHAAGQPCTSPAQCNDGNPCTIDTCSGTPAICHNDPVANGSSPPGCTDGDVCDGVETCQNGTCSNGTAADCDDGKFCTDDTCDPVTGCPASPRPIRPGCCESLDSECEATQCTTRHCVAHVCEYDIIPNCCRNDSDCNDLNPCTDDSACIGAPNGTCTHTDVTGPRAGCGEPCSPGACQAGTCVQTPIVCVTDGDPCTEDVCDPGSSQCIHPRIAGCCASDADCADGDACTSDECDLDQHVCPHVQLFPGCTGCDADTDCDPLGACGQSVCNLGAGTCMDHTPPNCSDSLPRTQDVCVVDGPGQAHCEHPCFPGVCDDRNACNGVETCSPATGNCSAGTTPDCNDGDGCTDDRCDTSAGCVHTAKSGYARVGCGLDNITDALRDAVPSDVAAGVRSRLTKLTNKARTKLAAAQNGTGKRAQRALKATGKKLTAIMNGVEAARRRNKINGDLADRLVTAARGASDALQGLTP